jgi:hypothetical protein
VSRLDGELLIHFSEFSMVYIEDVRLKPNPRIESAQSVVEFAVKICVLYRTFLYRGTAFLKAGGMVTL